MNTIKMETIVERLDSLRPFPQFALDIINVLGDDEANANLLAEHVQHDPVITGRLLGLANSASNRAGASRTVTDVFSAISLLGFTRVRMLVTTFEIEKTYGQFVPEDLADGYWGHCIDVATASRVIAEHVGTAADMAYVSGLLHDIGALWLAATFPADYRSVVEIFARRGVNERVSVTAVERDMFGTDHAWIGGKLASLWGLPVSIQDAITGHHQPDALPPNRQVMAVHLAEVVCNALDLGERRRNSVHYLSEQVMPVLGLNWEDMPDMLGEIEARSRFMRMQSGIS